MSQYVPGQRWISSAEPDLGLGVITESEGRHLRILFPIADEERAYAQDTAPLTRIQYRAGDRITDHAEKEWIVEAVAEESGLLIYECVDDDGIPKWLPETRLGSAVQFNGPGDRLLAGQLSKPAQYAFRVRSLYAQARCIQSPVRGLLGPRLQWLPHQIYIADEVTQRFAPRVLLADEVGLGKTIEAGLILHQQLLSGQASRVLIVVPEPLLHQWLVEMLRRFNLQFTILDEERCQAIEAPSMPSEDLFDEEEGEPEESIPAIDNPFESAQLVLCGLDFLANSPKRQMQAIAAGWDLLVVDEAHHLHWSPENGAATENDAEQDDSAYACVEALAQRARGVLLLTATPEQLGMAGHFARLRLLDPSRYHNLDTFVAEESDYQQVSDLIKSLNASDGALTDKLTDQQRQTLADYLGEERANADLCKESGARLVEDLLDRHGTGRVLFRNTRASVGGFPGRALNAWPLSAIESPEAELDAGHEQALDIAPTDPRLRWLVQFLKEDRQRKVLLICAQAETALSLHSHLSFREAIAAAVFHEGTTLVERDRAAAWFAEEEQGAQILLCSEIGSEGRNFQFAHDLVLFDLPTNPDLLEQRIGRLDRIGQSDVVQIHVPHVEGSREELLMRWYAEGLDAFARPLVAGDAIRQTFAAQLEQCLSGDRSGFEPLLTEAKAFCEAERDRQETGRDQLLEMNSCKPAIAAERMEALSTISREHELGQYLELICDQFGLDLEHHSDQAVIIQPSDQMADHSFPGLPEEGMTATWSRELATSREDMHFLTWEHPFVTGSFERVLESDFGSASLGTISVGGLERGTLLMEVQLTFACGAPKSAQLDRYLEVMPQRMLIDAHGRDLANQLPVETLDQLVNPLPLKTGVALVKQGRKAIEQLIEVVNQRAKKVEQPLVAEAQQRMLSLREIETNRFEALAEVNPNLRAEELEFERAQTDRLAAYLAKAHLRMDAIRLLIVA